MKAVMFWNVEKGMSVEDIPEPTPGAGEMVIKVGRCGICGSDVHLTQEHGYFPENSVMGHELCGEVVEVGSGVEGFKIGDILTAQPAAGCMQCLSCLTAGPLLCERGMVPYSGGFAQYARVAARVSIKLPQALSLADGALVEPLAVSLHGVRMGDVGPGKRVLVLGAGSIGLGCVYWARKLGASRVVAASRSRRAAAMAEAMGADDFIQTGEGEMERLQAAFGGALPDVVLECIGVVGALAHSIQFVKPTGTVVSLGFCTKPDPVFPAFSTWKQIRLLFSMAYTLEDFQFTVDMLERGHLEPRQWVSGVLPLEAVPKTIEELRAGRSETKLHVDPWLGR